MIANIVAKGEADERLRKYNDIMRVDRELRRTDPNFKGFYMDNPYPYRLQKMIENYLHIMAQMPQDPLGEEDKVNPESPQPDVVLEVEDKPSTSAWVAKGNMRHKVVHMPEKVKERTLQLMPDKS